jgi:multimeric flavodoxin WrbA
MAFYFPPGVGWSEGLYATVVHGEGEFRHPHAPQPNIQRTIRTIRRDLNASLITLLIRNASCHCMVQQFRGRKKEFAMKVLALNSSPRSQGQSKTELMLRHLVEGMLKAGAEVETVELRKKKVNNCIGCYTCWTKTPGVCVHKDDMTNELFPKWLESDLVIYATPLYHFTVNATLKAFIERTLPVLEPFFIRDKGRTSHPLRHKPPRVVALSVAGFPDDSVFDQLTSYMNIFKGLVVAQIYRPGAEMLTMPFYKERASDVLAATEQAGKEIVESMSVSDETMARIRQPIVDDWDAALKIGDVMWKTCIAEGITPKEFGEKGIIPRPDSIDTFLLIMPLGFNAEAAGDTKATLQFIFSGQEEGTGHFTIENGSIMASEGPADNPDLVIETPFDLWMDIITGKADGQQMFMQGKYKVNGDLSLLMRLNQFFGG